MFFTDESQIADLFHAGRPVPPWTTLQKILLGSIILSRERSARTPLSVRAALKSPPVLARCSFIFPFDVFLLAHGGPSHSQ